MAQATNPNAERAAPKAFLSGLAPDGVYQGISRHIPSWSLTPRLHPYLHLYRYIGGLFLWHYPSDRSDWTLSSILPYGARTFLSWFLAEIHQRLPSLLSLMTSKVILNC